MKRFDIYFDISLISKDLRARSESKSMMVQRDGKFDKSTEVFKILDRFCARRKGLGWGKEGGKIFR